MKKTRPIHVLHLVLSLHVGGAERVVCTLVKGRSEIVGHSVCCLDAMGSLGHELAATGVRIDCLPRAPGVDWGLAYRLRRYCQRHHVDIIHAHGETPWFYAALASFCFPWKRVHCMTTIHGYGGGDRQQLRGYGLWKFLALLSAKVVFVSKIFEQELNAAGINQNKTVTIPNGIVNPAPCTETSEASVLKRQYAIEEDTFVIGIVARLSPIKNHALLLKAVRRLIDRTNRPVRLLVVGDGPELATLENLSTELGLADHVVFCGEHTDVAPYYHLFDAFVLPSFSEGISMTILEAMAAKVPVIASEVGGNVEIIRHGKNGLLFPSGDLQILVERLQTIMNNSQLVEQLVREGHTTVTTTFNMESMLQAYRRVYNEICGQQLFAGKR